MILQTVSASSETKGLILRALASRQPDSADGEDKGILVPMQHLLIARQFVKERIAFAFLRQLYLKKANLCRVMTNDWRTQRARQQLPAQAHAQIGDIAFDGVPQQAFLRAEVGMDSVL